MVVGICLRGPAGGVETEASEVSGVTKDLSRPELTFWVNVSLRRSIVFCEAICQPPGLRP